MSPTMSRRSLLSGFGAALGTMAMGAHPAPARAATPPFQASSPTQQVNLSVPFGAGGLMGGDSEGGQAYVERLIKTALVPPLSDVGIYAHGWLTDQDDLMVIYDTMTEGFNLELRTLDSGLQASATRAPMTAPQLSLPTSMLMLTTHWPARQRGEGPIGLADLATFSKMEARANLVGRVGMARLIGLIWERLLAEPALASTRLTLVGHSFGARVFASALSALAVQAPDAFAAIQPRNPIDLVMLQPAMPADALEPNDLTQAHPFAQLVNYRNLRILSTMSRWDIPLRRFYPANEAQQPSDAVYARAAAAGREQVPALGAAGPSEATWRAFNGELPRANIPVDRGFRYADVFPYADGRLVVADLTPLHAAHHREDALRPPGQLPPFGRPDRRSLGLSGYHTDIYSREVYQLVIGFALARAATLRAPTIRL